MEVDDRKLRFRDRMLRDHQRGARMVLANRRLRELGLAPFSRTRTDLAGRQLLRAKHTEEQQTNREERGDDSFHGSVRSEPVSRILSPPSLAYASYGGRRSFL